MDEDIRNLAAVKVATDLLTDVNAKLSEFRNIKASVARDASMTNERAADAAQLLSGFAAIRVAIEAIIAANVPEHEWDGASIRFRNPNGEWGTWVNTARPGPKGDKPAHLWDGTRLAFENPDGSAGVFVDLKGAPGSQLAGINDQIGASYTISIGDIGFAIAMSSASPNQVVIPAHGDVPWTSNAIVHVMQRSSGATTISAAPGVTLIAFESKLTLHGPGAWATCIRLSENVWAVNGNLI